MDRRRLVERAHHVRRGDYALKRVGAFGGARDEFPLERSVVVLEGDNENALNVVRL